MNDEIQTFKGQEKTKKRNEHIIFSMKLYQHFFWKLRVAVPGGGACTNAGGAAQKSRGAAPPGRRNDGVREVEEEQGEPHGAGSWPRRWSFVMVSHFESKHTVPETQ